MTVLPPTRNMSKNLVGGKVSSFPKFQTSASQTETLFPLSSPPPSVSPFILRGRENALSTSRETPASSVLHPIAANPPPPSSIMPEPVPDVVFQCNRNRNALKDLAAEAEAELPPRRRRRRAPYQNHSDHAVLRLTVAAPLSQPSTAPELFPLCRRSPPRIGFPAADRRPPHHTQQLGHGFVQVCTILHNFWFPANNKIVGKTEGGHSTTCRKRYSSSLIRANLTSPLTPYSSHERN